MSHNPLYLINERPEHLLRAFLARAGSVPQLAKVPVSPGEQVSRSGYSQRVAIGAL